MSIALVFIVSAVGLGVPAGSPATGGGSSAGPALPGGRGDPPVSLGLIALIRDSHDLALGKIARTDSDLAEAERVIRVLQSLPRRSAPRHRASLAQAQLRRTQLLHNLQVFRQEVDTWVTYQEMNEEYTFHERALVRVMTAAEALSALPAEQMPTGASAVATRLEQQREQLENTVRSTALKLTRLAFTIPGQELLPPPLPDLTQIPWLHTPRGPQTRWSAM